ncbi:MAG: EI24 domain-containing protein [Rhodospirillales bacterium]
MIDALVKGVQQLGDKKTQKPLWISIAVALGVFALLWTSSGALIKYTAVFDLDWLETIADGLGWVLVLVLTWALFPGVVSAVVALFLDQIAESVEARHYPDLGPAQGQPAGEQVMTALRFLGIMVSLNLLILPTMLMGPVYPVLFYCVNGYLLGREYFEMVAARRIDLAGTVRLRQAHGGRLFLTGVASAFLLTIPVVNLLTPVIATAAMVHQFEKWRRRGTRGQSGGPESGTPQGTHLTRPGANSVLDGSGPRA